MIKPHPNFMRSSKKFRSSCRGFTIIEVALAAAIMAMGISTSIVVLQRGFAMLDSARNITTAGQILVSQMEQLRMYDWATVSAYPAGPTTLTIDAIFTSSNTVGSRFTLTRSVSSPATEVIQITFRIEWRNYDGRTLSREMTTYYARYGIHDYFYNHT
jgi:prepilin-type N-terminal cleavage/methylation domain-containing protein